MRENPAGWMVFRCSGSETGDLEELLVSLGHETWTPRAWVSKRLPRRKARETVLLGMLPSYLFVRVGTDLRAMQAVGAKHSIWGPMVLRGEVVVIRDKDLEGLRSHDDRISPPRRWVDPLPGTATEGTEPNRGAAKVVRSGGSVKEADRGAQRRASRLEGPPISRLEGAQASTGEAPPAGNHQDAVLRRGLRVRVVSGPLAPLGIEAIVEEILTNGTVQLSTPFGGRVSLPASSVKAVCS